MVFVFCRDKLNSSAERSLRNFYQEIEEIFHIFVELFAEIANGGIQVQDLPIALITFHKQFYRILICLI
jgi:hypothetical protein